MPDSYSSSSSIRLFKKALNCTAAIKDYLPDLLAGVDQYVHIITKPFLFLLQYLTLESFVTLTEWPLIVVLKELMKSFSSPTLSNFR